MYLLKLGDSYTTGDNSTFTFHYVSIKTVSPEYTALPIVYLHSTMYLLKPIAVFLIRSAVRYLHSTMYLLKLSALLSA